MTFPGKELSPYTRANLALVTTKASIDYDITFLYDSETAPRDRKVMRLLRDQTDETLENSGLFSDHEVGDFGAPWHFSFSVASRISPTQLEWFRVSSMVLFLLPAYVRDELTLTVDVRKGLEPWKCYQYVQSFRVWFHVVLAPAVFSPAHSEARVSQRVVDNMLLHFLSDWQQDAKRTTSAP